MNTNQENGHESQHVETTILWAGGWRTYVINPSQKQPIPQEEKEREKFARGRGFGINPSVTHENEEWLKCLFLKSLWRKTEDTTDDDKMVRIVRYIGGGD